MDGTPRARAGDPDDAPTGGVERREAYTWGYADRTRRRMSGRTAAREAAFLLPHLRPGMRLLDFGCGTGTTTVGLAAAVAPGEVVGLDIGEPALALAAERGVGNVRFDSGSVYALPFPDASFDAAFSRSVLEHLAEPLAALREVRRVLKPGGVIGVRDGDHGGAPVLAPPSPLVEEAMAPSFRVWERNGGNPRRGREHHALLRAAGFARIEASAGAHVINAAGGPFVSGTPEAARDFAAGIRTGLLSPTFIRTVGELGWAEQPRLEELAGAWDAWGAHPDAFCAWLMCQAVGWAE